MTRSHSFIYLALSLPPLSNTTEPSTSKDMGKFGNTWPTQEIPMQQHCIVLLPLFHRASSFNMASSGVKKEASSVPADVDGNTWKKSLMRSCHHGFLIHQLYFYVEMTGPDAAALLTILALLCFSLLLQLLFRYLIMRLLFCFSSFVTSRQLRWEHATLFLACLKVFFVLLDASLLSSFWPPWLLKRWLVSSAKVDS